MDTPIQAGDRLVVIAEDDDTTRLSGLTALRIDEGAIARDVPEPPAPERTLILGWNWRAPVIMKELDNYVAPGSLVTVVADFPEGEQDEGRRCPAITQPDVRIPGRAIPPTGDTLESLNIETYDHIIMLCYSDTLDIAAS